MTEDGLEERPLLRLTLELARNLATDDVFRETLCNDPVGVLARLGVEIYLDEIPETAVLPSRELCQARLLGLGTGLSQPAQPETEPACPGLGPFPAGSPERIKRPFFSFFFLRDQYLLDAALLLTGELDVRRVSLFVAVDLLSQSEQEVSGFELSILQAVPSSRWIPLERLTSRFPEAVPMLNGLYARGLLLSSREEEDLATLRWRDAKLAGNRWEPYAAIYHFMAKWRDQGLEEGTDWWRSLKTGDVHRERLARLGSPPSPFHTAPNASGTINLPLIGPDPRLDFLRNRQTTRVFDRRRSLDGDQLATILHSVYGCQGLSSGDEVTCLRKTSPSGGGLHPVEAYPLILRVRGLKPGLYHYSVQDHRLEVLETLSRRAAESLANELCAGQSYFATASALFILTARFYRSFWKYENHKKAYKVLLMDAAHLSQTFYLTCAALGLGAFFTAAINEENIERRLGLDGFEEAPVGISGCGSLLAKGSGLRMPTVPFAPRRS